jgi:hypothetical protein
MIGDFAYRLALWLQADWLRSTTIIAGLVILLNITLPKLLGAWRQVTVQQRRRAFNIIAYATALLLLLLYIFRPEAEFLLALRTVSSLFFVYSATCWVYELAFYARRGWDFPSTTNIPASSPREPGNPSAMPSVC